MIGTESWFREADEKDSYRFLEEIRRSPESRDAYEMAYRTFDRSNNLEQFLVFLYALPRSKMGLEFIGRTTKAMDIWPEVTRKELGQIPKEFRPQAKASLEAGEGPGPESTTKILKSDFVDVYEVVSQRYGIPTGWDAQEGLSEFEWYYEGYPVLRPWAYREVYLGAEDPYLEEHQELYKENLDVLNEAWEERRDFSSNDEEWELIGVDRPEALTFYLALDNWDEAEKFFNWKEDRE